MINYENLSSTEFTSLKEELVKTLDNADKKIDFAMVARSHQKQIYLEKIGRYKEMLRMDGHNVKVSPPQEAIQDIKEKTIVYRTFFMMKQMPDL